MEAGEGNHPGCTERSGGSLGRPRLEPKGILDSVGAAGPSLRDFKVIGREMMHPARMKTELP
jgi:hypothetical protein